MGFYNLSTTWENTHGCDENYRCETALHVLSMISQAYSIIIYHGVSVPGHGREVVDILNVTDKRFRLHLWKLCNWMVIKGVTRIRPFTVQPINPMSV